MKGSYKLETGNVEWPMYYELAFSCSWLSAKTSVWVNAASAQLQGASTTSSSEMTGYGSAEK
jgi:hypothetical protein